MPVLAAGIIITNTSLLGASICYTIGATMIGVGLPWALILPKINKTIVSSYNKTSAFYREPSSLNLTLSPNGVGIALCF